MIANFLTELSNLSFSYHHIIFLFLGVSIGLIIGVLPSFGSVTGLTFLLPFLINIDEISTLAFIFGVIISIPTSDTFTSVLTGKAGSSLSEATVLDGFPLAQKGKAKNALAAAFIASLLGGLLGSCLLGITFFIIRPILKFLGPAEFFMLTCFGVIMVGILSSKSFFKGLNACCLGITLGFIGNTPYTYQLSQTLNTSYFDNGFSLVIMAFALFTYPQIINLLEGKKSQVKSSHLKGSWLKGIKSILKHKGLLLRTAGFGALLGIIPGIGSNIDWVTYGYTVDQAKNKTQFGKGDIRGIIAPESANNAKVSTSLLTTLLLGIPNSGATAIILAVLIFINKEPSIEHLLYSNEIIFIIIIILIAANFLVVFLCFSFAKPISYLSIIPPKILALTMLILISLIVYQINGSSIDLILLLIIGELGRLVKRFGWSRNVILVGFILSQSMDFYFKEAIEAYSLLMFFRPGVLLIILILLCSILFARQGGFDESINLSGVIVTKLKHLLPHLLFTFFVLILFIYFIYGISHEKLIIENLPLLVAEVGLVTTVLLILSLIIKRKNNPAFFDIYLNEENSNPKFYINFLLPLIFYTLIFFLGFIPAIILFGGGFLKLKTTMSNLNIVLFLSSMVLFLITINYTIGLDYLIRIY